MGAMLMFSRLSCALAWILALTLGFPSHASAEGGSSSPGLEKPRGAVRPYTLGDHLRHEATSSVDIQGWEYTLELDSGEFFFITGFCTRVWFMPAICGVEISWADPAAGRDEVMGHRVAEAEFKQVGDPVALHFGDRNRLLGMPGEGHRLHVETDWHIGLVLDVTFERAWPGFVIGDGVFRLPDGAPLVKNAVGMPRARFRGTATWGGKPGAVRGWASMQRMEAARLPTLALQRRQWVVSRHPGVSVLATSFLTDDSLGGDTGGWIAVVGEEGVRFESRDVTVQWSRTRPMRNCLLPGAFLFVGRSSDGLVELGGEGWPPMQVFGMTDSLSVFLQTVIRSVMGTPIFSRLAGISEARGEGLGGKAKKGSVIQRVECRDRGQGASGP